MLPGLSTREEVAIQGDNANGLAGPEVGEGPATEAVVDGLEHWLLLIIRGDDGDALDAAMRRCVRVDGVTRLDWQVRLLKRQVADLVKDKG